MEPDRADIPAGNGKATALFRTEATQIRYRRRRQRCGGAVPGVTGVGGIGYASPRCFRSAEKGRKR
jgi:hypothetical protein